MAPTAWRTLRRARRRRPRRDSGLSPAWIALLLLRQRLRCKPDAHNSTRSVSAPEAGRHAERRETAKFCSTTPSDVTTMINAPQIATVRNGLKLRRLNAEEI